MYIPTFYSTSFATGDYYIIILPNSGPDQLLMNDDFPTCQLSGYYEWCYTFPDINWAIMKFKTSIIADSNNQVTSNNKNIIFIIFFYKYNYKIY